MEEYKELLQTVINRQIASTVFCEILLSVVVIAAIVAASIYLRKLKKNTKTRNDKQIKQCRDSVIATASVVIICAALAIIMLVGCIDTVSDIKQDINGNTYACYTGEYTIGNYAHSSRFNFYDRSWSVYLDNGDVLYLHTSDPLEFFEVSSGRHTGTIVYGENSKIIVKAENGGE